MLAIIIVALIRCHVKRRKFKSADTIENAPHSPIDSFIQTPPRLLETYDTGSNSNPYKPTFMSKTNPEEAEGLASAIQRPSDVRTSLSEDLGSGVSPLHTSTISHTRTGAVLLRTTSVSETFDIARPRESLKSTYSMASLSPKEISPDFRPVSENPHSPSIPPPASTNSTEAAVSPESGNERNALPRRHPSKVMDPDTATLTSSVRYTSKSDPPPRDSSLPSSKRSHSYTRLASPPVPSSHTTSEQGVLTQLPSVLRHSLANPAFLASPPVKRSQLGSHHREHSQGPSQPHTLPSLSVESTSKRKSSNVDRLPQYASVAYAQAKASKTRPRSKSAAASVRIPVEPSRKPSAPPVTHRSNRSEDTPKKLFSSESDREFPNQVLSLRSRSRPRSTPRDGPERI